MKESFLKLTKLLHLLAKLLAVVTKRTFEEMTAGCLCHPLNTHPGGNFNNPQESQLRVLPVEPATTAGSPEHRVTGLLLQLLQAHPALIPHADGVI